MLFKYVRHLRTKKPSANTPSRDPVKDIELFREFFASVHEIAFMNSERLDSRDVHAPMPDLQFTKEDIFRLLRVSSPFCSMEPDEIHPRILKESSYELAGPFYTLFQQSLNFGSLPHSWKTAHITPAWQVVHHKPLTLHGWSDASPRLRPHHRFNLLRLRKSFR